MRVVAGRASRRTRAGLWAVPGFSRFWGAFAISEVGSQATQLAWPLLGGLLGGAIGLRAALAVAAGVLALAIPPALSLREG